MPKFSLEVLERCVFQFIENEDPDVIFGAAFGEDVALRKLASPSSAVTPVILLDYPVQAIGRCHRNGISIRS